MVLTIALFKLKERGKMVQNKPDFGLIDTDVKIRLGFNDCHKGYEQCVVLITWSAGHQIPCKTRKRKGQVMGNWISGSVR